MQGPIVLPQLSILLAGETSLPVMIGVTMGFEPNPYGVGGRLKMRKCMKYPARLCGLVLATLSTFASFAGWQAAPAQAQAGPSPVILSEAVSKQLVDRVEALGTLRANESVTVTAQVTETITALHFEDGQEVKKGQVLAEMTSAEELAQLQEAEATVREAKDQLDRVSPLAERGVSSEAVLSERRRDHETAIARHEASKSRLSDRQIVAPFDGVVGLRRISVGALVEPGTVITTIDDDSVMKLDFSVPATFLSTLRVGLPVIAEAQAYGERVFEGKVSGIDSRVDPITRSITVRAIIPNESGVLKAGVLMTVEVLKNERQAVVLPEQAIIPHGRDTHVLVVDRKAEAPVAERRDVKLGTRVGGEVEILEGLKAGEFVISDGTLRVRPGQKVSITAIDNGGEPLVKLLEQAPENPS